jgi:hypothetical protein
VAEPVFVFVPELKVLAELAVLMVVVVVLVVVLVLVLCWLGAAAGWRSCCLAAGECGGGV